MERKEEERLVRIGSKSELSTRRDWKEEGVNFAHGERKESRRTSGENRREIG